MTSITLRRPEAAGRDRQVRERLIARLGELMAGSDQLSAIKRAELRGQISVQPDLNRFSRTTSGGLLRIDTKAITAETPLRQVPAAQLRPAPVR